jgi:prepilin-type processing-associated H-X9-DG protein
MLLSRTHRTCGRGNRSAFSVIELLVVIGILALLLALLFPMLSRARASAKVVACAANLRQIAMLLRVYAQANDGRLPYQAQGNDDWSGTLTPLGQGQPVFHCPEDDNIRRDTFGASAIRSYGVNNGPFGEGAAGLHAPWPVKPDALPARIHQVPARIFLVGENGGQFTDSAAWVGIAEAEALDGIAWGTHRLKSGRGDNYAFGDGHVEFHVKQQLDQWRVDAEADAIGGPQDPWKWR